MQPLFYLWIAFALNYIDRQMVYSMLPALEKDLKFSPVALAWIGTLFLWSYTPVMPIAGMLADRYRRDQIILVSLALWSISTLGCGLANTPAAFLFWRVMMGITEALYYPTAMALIAGHYPENRRSRALGIHQSAQFAGGIFGGWYGGWAADHAGWRTAFLAAGATGLAFAPFLRRGLPASKPPATRSTQSASIFDLIRSLPFIFLALTFSSYCSIQWIFFAWFPSHLQDRYGLSMTASGSWATLFVQGAIIAGILVGGFLADRLRTAWTSSRIGITAAGAFLCAPFAYFAFSTDSLPLSLCLSSGFGFFAGGLSANAFAAAFELVDESLRGLAAGLLNMCGGLVSGGMILIAGYYRTSHGFAPLMLMAMTATMLLAAALLVATQRTVKHPGAVQAPL